MFILYTMSTIYKIYKLKNNTVEKIYIFNNDTTRSIDTIFENYELEIIKKYGIVYENVNNNIYPDDTIETIKKKFINIEKTTSIDEIYLFSNVKESFNSENVYKNLTQNGKLQLTKNILTEYLLNISNFDIKTLPDKSVYSYDDILSLNLEKYDLINKPLGQKFTYKNLNISYIINPFNLLEVEDIFKKNVEYLVNTTNKQVLLTNNNIKSNIIYLCEATDVLNYAIDNSIDEKNIIKMYYPYLYDNEIFNKTELINNKPFLLKKSKDFIDKNFIKNIENVELFHKIYNNRKSNIEYIKQGIKYISFNIIPSYNFLLPLEVIFKIIHSDKNIPLIKYNPSKRMEKIYKLYCDKIATNGKKIPYLSKGTIFKIIKNIATQKSIAFYINNDDNNIVNFICHIYQDASINVELELDNPYNINACETLIKNNINKIITIISEFIEESGYKLNIFDNLYDNNIEIENINYEYYLPIKNNIILSKLTSCITSIFNVEQGNLKDIIRMRFKRVNNYNEMTAIESTIIDLIQNEVEQEIIIKNIKENYGLNEKDVIELLKDVLNSIQVIEKTGKKKKIKLKNNPGFLTTIKQDQFKNNITILINNINNVRYIDILSIYIDSLIRITQSPDTTEVKLEEISKMCSKKELKEEVKIDEIAPSPEKELEIKIAEELIFDSPEKVSDDKEDLLNILMGSDVDDSDDEIQIEEEEIEIDDEELQEGGVNSDIEFGSDLDSDSDKKLIKESSEKKKKTKKKIKIVEKDDKEEKIEQKLEGKKLEKDVTGMSLSNPNPFYKRMETRDPKLFQTDIDGKFKAYSRLCPWNVKRQPVILTDEEKANIDKNHPGSYDEAIKYGSSKDNQYWYICPRYWSLKYDTSLTEEDVKSGKYGNIIPDKSKKVPKDSSIFEFTDNKEHTDNQGNYVKHYPGFLKEGSHPDDLCVPCCFKSWDSPAQKERRDQCINNKVVEKEVDDQDDYIKGSDKFPLDKNRWGYLPIAIQKYLQTDNKKCQISITNTNLKPNHLCLLRRGVEFNKNQSFISCLSDLYIDYIVPKVKTLTTKDMKNILITSLNLDLFISLQNGGLITNFKDKKINYNIKIDDVYKKTNIYKSVDLNNVNQKNYLIQVISAYQNFIDYLNNDNIIIDYTYLWDLICLPNKNLFKDGINLIILEMNENDITNNINLICPTNHYSSELFDINRNTAILIKNGNYYEPIYAVEDKIKSIVVTKLFNTRNKNLTKNIINVLENIDKTVNKYCGTYPSLPNVYTFKENIKLSKLVKLLISNNYTIEKQIINYNSNTIGVIAEKENKKGFIPCLPSSIILDYDYTWMDDNIWDNFKDTINFLNFVYEDNNKNIPCKPLLKVFEDEFIIGIITETNQFIALNEPELDTFDDNLESIKENNYLNADIKSSISNERDRERINYIKNIELETSFYNSFRNTIRILLGLQKHVTIRKEIENILNLETMLYFEKLKIIDTKIRELTKESIQFADYKEDELLKIDKISSCYNISNDKCREKKFCSSDEENNKCKLLIPKINLINKNDNEKIYFSKISDELIRYIRIKEFIFESKTFLSFNEIKFDLNDDEIILLQSLLTQDYFENIEIMNPNPYINYNSYYTTNPQKTQYYTNEIIDEDKKDDIKKEKKKLNIKPKLSVKEAIEEKEKIYCKKIERSIQDKWKDILPKDCNEIYYDMDNNSCSFKILINIINSYNLINPKSIYEINSINKLKNILIETYNELINDDNINIIYDILDSEGKSEMINKIKLGTASLDILILSEEYYITNFDLWILSNKLELPILLISPTKIQYNSEVIFKLNKLDFEMIDIFYIVKLQKTKIKDEQRIIYKLIECNNDYKIKYDELSDEFKKQINNNEYITLDSFISKYKKTKKKLKIIQQDKEVDKQEEKQEIKIKIKKNKK